MNEAVSMLNESISMLVDVHHEIKKLRVSTEFRNKSLLSQGKTDDITADLHSKLLEMEEYLESMIKLEVTSHSVWQWAKGIKGITPDLLAQVMGRCKIELLVTPGKMKAHAGIAPGKGIRVKGQKPDYDPELKSAVLLIGRQLRLAKGKYYEYYLKSKEYYMIRAGRNGVQVVPSDYLPNSEEGNKQESAIILSLSHVDNMALRKMTSLFLVHLWEVWRREENLPTRRPYVEEYLGHTTILNPEGMIDRLYKEAARLSYNR